MRLCPDGAIHSGDLALQVPTARLSDRTNLSPISSPRRALPVGWHRPRSCGLPPVSECGSDALHRSGSEMTVPDLPELCGAGVSGNDTTWNGTLRTIRREVGAGRLSAADAGNLGVLLMLAGRKQRALGVFSALELVASRGPAGSTWNSLAALPSRNSRPAETSHLADDSGVQTHSETSLLADLVLSGQWSDARRFCRRMEQHMPSDRWETGGSISP